MYTFVFVGISLVRDFHSAKERLGIELKKAPRTRDLDHSKGSEGNVPVHQEERISRPDNEQMLMLDCDSYSIFRAC